MKPAPFAYSAPDTLPEALETLARYGADARVLAGGQSLLAMMNTRQCTPTHLIDINRIAALGGIAPTPGALVLGATARMVDVENDPLVRREYRFIVDALKLVATPPIRNRGTVVGSLAHGDPCAELPAVALCADAVLVLQSASGGVRELAARTFYRGRFATRAAADEVIVAVRVPRLPPRSGFAIVETARRYNGVAVAGAVARVTVVDEVIRAATVVLFGVADTPVLCTAADGFVGLPVGDEQSIAAAAAATTRGLSPVTDVLADAAYRLHAATVLVRRAVAQALAGCPGGDA